jgi:sortase A
MEGKQWRRAERPLLWTTLMLSLVWALWPAGEWLYGWSNQRALAAQWHLAQAHMAQSHKVSASASPSNGKRPAAASKTKNSAFMGRVKTRVQPTPAALEYETRSLFIEDWPPTRLTCSKIGLDAVVVQGVGPQELKQGPGHDPHSALPGEGNCVIAAHRNAFGWWFRRLDQLGSGDLIVLETLGASFIYRVSQSQVLDDDDTHVLAQPKFSSPAHLTLYSCTLPKSKRRIVVTALLQTGT